MLNWQVYETFTNKKEFEIIKNYQMTNDRSILSNAIGNLKKASPVMIRSIVAIFEGKVIIPQYKRAAGRKNNYERNIPIAFEVQQNYKTIGHFREKISKEIDKKVDGAATIVGKKYHLSEDAVLTIYRSIARRVDMDYRYAPDMVRDILFAEDMGIDVLLFYQIATFLLNERFEAFMEKHRL